MYIVVKGMTDLHLYVCIFTISLLGLGLSMCSLLISGTVSISWHKCSIVCKQIKPLPLHGIIDVCETFDQ